MKEIKNIDKNSLAKIIALIYGLVGFFTALVMVMFFVVNVVVQKSAISAIFFNIGIGLLLAILMALINASIGLVMGYLTAIIYNWLAGKIGGVKVELEEVINNQQLF